jgi:predicted molibdopterin-dependent oxidoreductase YjgC
VARLAENPPAGGNQTLSFSLDGVTLSALAGDTIASALYGAGIRAWRRARPGDERGLLCGIGVCFDCLVTVDGLAGQRACQVSVRDGMKVETNLERSERSEGRPAA